MAWLGVLLPLLAGCATPLDEAAKEDTVAAYRGFLERCPRSPQAPAVKEKLDALLKVQGRLVKVGRVKVDSLEDPTYLPVLQAAGRFEAGQGAAILAGGMPLQRYFRAVPSRAGIPAGGVGTPGSRPPDPHLVAEAVDRSLKRQGWSPVLSGEDATLKVGLKPFKEAWMSAKGQGGPGGVRLEAVLVAAHARLVLADGTPLDVWGWVRETVQGQPAYLREGGRELALSSVVPLPGSDLGRPEIARLCEEALDKALAAISLKHDLPKAEVKP